MTELAGEGMTALRVRVAREDVALLRYLLEAHDGLANLVATPDGTITLITPTSRAAELAALLDELTAEIPSLSLVP